VRQHRADLVRSAWASLLCAHPAKASSPIKNRKAERRQTRNLPSASWRRCGRALGEARSSPGVPPRHLRPRTNPAAQLQNVLPATRQRTGVTRSPPVPVQRHGRRPVVMPAGRLPEAAREHGDEPCPREPLSLRCADVIAAASCGERDNVSRNCIGDACQGHPSPPRRRYLAPQNSARTVAKPRKER